MCRKALQVRALHTPPQRMKGEKMLRLYKGRYLIAVYDNNDQFVDCATSIMQLKMFKSKSVYSQISRNQFFSMRKYKIYLIDCLEKHDDVFAEEDEIFLQDLQCYKSKTDIYKSLAEKYGKSLRTIQRLVSKGKIKIEDELGEVGNVI